jgi:dTDP-4-amino-4,6-dideoxygalactose transaminase
MAALSFHETKNIISGEGGALLINDSRFTERAEIVWEKGTNRSKFFRGEVDKYTWVDLGSSYLPGEIVAAFLWAQLEDADSITERRRAIWGRYHAAFGDLETAGLIRRPIIPASCRDNAHLYYLLLPDLAARTSFISQMRASDIHPVFHYVPLHSSPFGHAVGRAVGDMAVTSDSSERLVRLPFWIGIEAVMDQVVPRLAEAIAATCSEPD